MQAVGDFLWYMQMRGLDVDEQICESFRKDRHQEECFDLSVGGHMCDRLEASFHLLIILERSCDR